jgi:hypothetical protein
MVALGKISVQDIATTTLLVAKGKIPRDLSRVESSMVSTW